MHWRGECNAEAGQRFGIRKAAPVDQLVPPPYAATASSTHTRSRPATFARYNAVSAAASISSARHFAAGRLSVEAIPKLAVTETRVVLATSSRYLSCSWIRATQVSAPLTG